MKSKERHSNRFLGVNNNLFALKLLFRSSPGIVIYRCAFSVLEAVVYLTNLLFLRYAVNLVQNEGTYGAILKPLLFIAVMLVIYHSSKAVLDAVLLPRLEYRLQCGLKLSALNKASKFDMNNQNTVIKMFQQIAKRDMYEKLQFVVEDLSNYAIVKGDALSIQAYGKVGARTYGDIDILISKKHINNIEKMLLEHDFHSNQNSHGDRVMMLIGSHQVASWHKNTFPITRSYRNLQMTGRLCHRAEDQRDTGGIWMI